MRPVQHRVVISATIDGHLFGKTHIDGQRSGQGSQWNQILRVLPGHHYSVDFDLNPSLQQSIEGVRRDG